MQGEMKDPEKMNREEKRRYIFEDASFEGRPRVKWIIDCMLGDIRTFLDGIESYINNKEKFIGKPPRGGGNLSVPILISTALEFVAALYAGKTRYMKNISYNAKNNVKRFIERFFPREYKEIPLLFWKGIRNGLVHTFSPKPFRYKNICIRFQFYVEDKDFPSHIRKYGDTIVVSINVFELYTILENAIIDYINELKDEEDLQNNFIKAWSSIEEDSYIEGNEYRDDAEALLNYLGSGSCVLLLEELNRILNTDVLRLYTIKIRRS